MHDHRPCGLERPLDTARTYISDTWTYVRRIYMLLFFCFFYSIAQIHRVDRSSFESCVVPPDKTTVYIIK